MTLIGADNDFAIMAVLAVRLLGAMQRLDGWQRGLALGLAGSFAYLAVHSLVDNVLVNNSHLVFGVLLALSAYVVSDGRSRAESLSRRGKKNRNPDIHVRLWNGRRRLMA